MQSTTRRLVRTLALRAAGIAAAVAAAGSCGKHVPPATELVARPSATLPTDPAAPAWRDVPAFTAPLVLQDMVEPRLMTPSTPAVQVQALSDGARIAFRLSWTDSTHDDLPGAARFSDACAVQLPAQAGPNLPAPQMGEVSGRVEITYWSAAWQADVDGRADSIQALYPNASVDHYPFEAASLPPGSTEQQEMERRYAPARGAGHMTHPEGRPVQDLLAEGPGSLTPAPQTHSDGRGARGKASWSVVIVRALPETLRGQPRTQVAFAIWDGARQEVGARKMRSVWTPLALAEVR